MFDDFIVRAFAAGIGLAFITGPLGCFIVWRRLSYFGDTIAHTALLGVVIAYALDFNIIIAVFVVSCLLALSLLFLQRRTNLPDDALLGLLAHSVLAIGLVLLGILSFIRIDLMGLLFGDILSVNVTDLLFVWIGGGIVLIVLILIWRPLFAGTVNLELANSKLTVPAKRGLQININTIKTIPPPIQTNNKSVTLTERISPKSKPMRSILMNESIPKRTNPIASTE